MPCNFDLPPLLIVDLRIPFVCDNIVCNPVVKKFLIRHRLLLVELIATVRYDDDEKFVFCGSCVHAGRAAELEQGVKGKLAETQKVFHEKVAAREAEFEKRVAGVDQRVSGVESNVADIKRATEYLGRSFNPVDFRSYVAEQVFSVWKPEFVVLHNTGTPTLKQWRERRGARKFA
jgi:hypothetical protein